jgi:hypothetical protein
MQQQQKVLSENSLSDEDCIQYIAKANIGKNLVYAGKNKDFLFSLHV